MAITLREANFAARWNRTPLTPNAVEFYKQGKMTKIVIIKENNPRYSSWGGIEAEYASYCRLKAHLRMPRVRLLASGGSSRYLAVQYVPGVPLSELLALHRLDELQVSLGGFIHDLAKMWRNTLKTMDEAQLVPENNLRLNCVRVIELLQSKFSREISRRPIWINEVPHPPLAELLEHSKRQLLQNLEPFMSWAHGDESLHNIIFPTAKNAEYYAIDPRKAAEGFYTPAQSADYLIGYTLLFQYNWETPVLRIGSKRVDLVYGTTTDFRAGDRVLRAIFLKLVESLRSLAPDETEMLREYLFVNLARSCIDEFKRGNPAKTTPYKMAHLASAIEIKENLTRGLGKPSYLS